MRYLTVLFLLSCSILNTFAQTTLKEAFKPDFMIGASLNSSQFTEQDAIGVDIVKTQFNTISPENVLKWASVHPKPDQYSFNMTDRYVDFGVKNKMFIIGHTLVWHNQTPKWVFEEDNGNSVTRDVLLKRLHDHIQMVVGRYKGKINGWDVVNEALNEDGTMRQTQWYKIIGGDYIIKAFQYAHEADPNAELYYNDYSLENTAKRNGAIALIKNLLAAKVPVKAIGLQGHDKLRDFPTVEQQDATITAFANLGIRVNITELDIDVLPSASQYRGADVTANYGLQDKLNPYKYGLPDAVQAELAKRYAELFRVFLRHRKDIDRITFWCVKDGDSWLNNWPVRGRTSYPLLFDRAGKPKPAFDAVLQTTLI
ncbi:MAG: endo-1,4-beta-xylanase, partial [Acidobacteriota bacterium]